MAINIQFYEPLVSDFCAYAEKKDKNSYPPHGLFVPYTFESYTSAKKKIFYVGRDTYGWVKFSEMLNDYKKGQIDNYLDKNSQVVTAQGENDENSDKHSLKENWKTGYSFWTFCQKLHLYITTGELKNNLRYLTPEDYSIIEEMGYSNTNAIETSESLYKMYDYNWDKVGIKDWSVYYDLVDKSKPIVSLDNLLKAYKPDLIIIFNWGFPDSYLQGLSIGNTKCEEEGILRVRSIVNNNTQIIETSHPNRLRFFGSPYDSLYKIGDKARELLKG
jgi:hypothetical protein